MRSRHFIICNGVTGLRRCRSFSALLLISGLAIACTDRTASSGEGADSGGVVSKSDAASPFNTISTSDTVTGGETPATDSAGEISPGPRAAAAIPAENKWGTLCAPPSAASGGARIERRCAITQIVAADPAGKQVVLGTAVDFFDSKDIPTIRFRFSPDAQQDRGIGVKVDNNREFRLPISQCDTKKCEAFGRLSDSVLASFQKGRMAQVAFISASSGQVTAPVSLIGFAKALETLRAGEPR